MIKCKINGCYNEVDGVKHRTCGKCQSRSYRKRKPYTTSYQGLKDHAKSRGIAFELTLEEWCRWCDETGYLAVRGPGEADMTVDRILAYKGYSIDNIQMLTRKENGLKSKTERKNDPAKRFEVPPGMPF